MTTRRALHDWVRDKSAANPWFFPVWAFIVLVGVVLIGTILALALAGCGTRPDSQGTPVVYEVTVGDALAVTGFVLLVPTILLAVVFFVMGIDYEYSWTRTEAHKRIAKIALAIGCGLLGLACIFWIAAIWMSVTG